MVKSGSQAGLYDFGTLFHIPDDLMEEQNWLALPICTIHRTMHFVTYSVLGLNGFYLHTNIEDGQIVNGMISPSLKLASKKLMEIVE